MKRGSGLLLTSVGLAASLGYVSGVALNPFLVAIARDIGTTVPLLGQIPAITLALSAVLGLAVGPLADQIGHRRILLLGLVALVVGSAGTALAGNYLTLLVATAIGAVSGAILLPMALAIVGDRYAPADHRRAIAVVMASTSAAEIIGIPLLATVAGLADWRAAFVVLAGVALVVTFVELRAIPPDSLAPLPGLRLSGALAAYTVLARHGPTRGLVGSSFLRGICASLVFIYFGAFLIERHGLTVPEVGWAYTGTGIGFLVGSLAVAGRLGRMSLWSLQIVGLALAGLVMAAPMIFPLGALVAIAMVTAGFTVIAIVNTAGTTVLASLTPAGYATTMTGNQAANVAGWAAGGSVGGLLIALGGYGALGWSTLVAGVVAGLVVWLVRPRPTSRKIAALPPVVGDPA